MKKLFLTVVIVTGFLCLMQYMKGAAVKPSACAGKLPYKEMLLPVERLMWTLHYSIQ